MALTQMTGLVGVRRQTGTSPAGIELRGVGDPMRFELPVGAVPVLGAVHLGLPGVDEAAVVQVSELGARGFTGLHGRLE